MVMLQLNAMLSPAALQSSLEAAFPRVQSCMAYGSSVFTQKNHDSSSSLIDLVFEVQDPVAWHAANLERNPSHYSFLKLFGASAIADFQQNYGAGVYYNTLVPLEIEGQGTRLIKYGVVSSSTLCDDLQNWTSLYLSGRMHKPVNLLTSNEQLNAASSLNLSHALHYALLCLPDKFSERELFTRIAGISYLGDFRMTFGENPKKVRNIVAGNLTEFRALYKRKLQDSPFISRSIHDSDTFVTIASQPETRHTVVASLPSNVRTILTSNGPLEERVVTKKQLQRAVASIVTRYSRSQSIKGIVTAGAVKTVAYVAQKLQRTYFSNKR